ncbi:MAG: hypothetical protein H6742_00170 [Alphaproteobacteria bacterium]|nr:hypothetical protein [Alphaproteobacteria bacterium]
MPVALSKDALRFRAGPAAPKLQLEPGDLRLRLFRPVVGERRCEPRDIPERLVVREQWEEPPCPVPERVLATRSGATRPCRRQVEPGPNTPKLIRLVRTPYRQETDRVRVDKSRTAEKRVRVADQIREPFGVQLRVLMVEIERPAFPKPTDVHPPLPTRSRLAADGWLSDPTPPRLSADERAQVEADERAERERL